MDMWELAAVPWQFLYAHDVPVLIPVFAVTLLVAPLTELWKPQDRRRTQKSGCRGEGSTENTLGCNTGAVEEGVVTVPLRSLGRADRGTVKCVFADSEEVVVAVALVRSSTCLKLRRFCVRARRWR